jgi:hypothetical protein
MPAVDRYHVDPGRVVHETLDGEVILIQLESGNYYSLRGAGADIWALLEVGATEREIVLELESRHHSDPGIGDAVRTLLGELAAERLVESEAAPAEVAPNGRARSGTSAPAGPFEPPVLEKYTDMRDYLLVDPLHDVDERGWPPSSANPA